MYAYFFSPVPIGLMPPPFLEPWVSNFAGRRRRSLAKIDTAARPR